MCQPIQQSAYREIYGNTKGNLTNNGNERIYVTSYLEVVCDTHLAEISHPAFNKLFIESEY